MKKIPIMIFSMLFVLILNTITTEAMNFSRGEHLSPSSKKPIIVNLNDGKLTLMSNRNRSVNGIVIIYQGYKSQSKQTMTLNDWGDFSIIEINGYDPAMKLIEIKLGRGHLDATYGYWLWGEKDGKLITYMTLDNLKNMGFYSTEDGNDVARVKSIIKDGEYILTFDHEVSGEYGYQRTFPIDAQIKVDWDEQAQWFSLTNVQI